MRTSRPTLAGSLTAVLLAAPGAAIAQEDVPAGLELVPTNDPAVMEVISLPHELVVEPGAPNARDVRALRNSFAQIAVGPGGGVWVYDGACGRPQDDCRYEAGQEMVCREPTGIERTWRGGACVWQAGVPGRYEAPYGSIDLAVASDGTLWALGEDRLQALDADGWTTRWRNDRYFFSSLTDLAPAPDGSTIAIGQMGGLDEDVGLYTEMVVVRADGGEARLERLGAPVPEGGWTVTAGTVAGDGSVWVGGISPRHGADTFAEAWGSYATRGFLVRYDGESLELLEPLAGEGNVQPGVAALAAAPDGSIWALLWRVGGEHGLEVEPLLARYVGGAWELTSIDAELPGRPGDSLAVDRAGTVWLTLDLGPDTGGVASFDGEDWTTHLAGSEPWELAVAPDDTVWVTNAPVVPEWGYADLSTVGLHAVGLSGTGSPTDR